MLVVGYHSCLLTNGVRHDVTDSSGGGDIKGGEKPSPSATPSLGNQTRTTENGFETTLHDESGEGYGQWLPLLNAVIIVLAVCVFIAFVLFILVPLSVKHRL